MIVDFEQPFACIVKHTNPCGAAVADKLSEAYRDALASDPMSAYGSIIGLNRKVDMETAHLLHETEFVECIIAPDFDDAALALLTKKKAASFAAPPANRQDREYRSRVPLGLTVVSSISPPTKK